MTKFMETLSHRWRDGINLVLGIWLIGFPWALGFAAEPAIAWNAYIVGVIIAVAALAALVRFHEWEEWVSAALGAWLIVSPWVLGFVALPVAFWTTLVVGLVVLGLAVWSGYVAHTDRRRTI